MRTTLSDFFDDKFDEHIMESLDAAQAYPETAHLKEAWRCFWNALLSQIVLFFLHPLKTITPRKQIDGDVKIPF